MKVPLLITLFLFSSFPPLFAEELSSCIIDADAAFETKSAKALDDHTLKLSELSLEKEALLKKTFSFFSLKQSLAKMKEVREKYKNEERKENDSFKNTLEVLKEGHENSLLICDQLSKEVITLKKD